jgi:TldD protein
MADDQTGVNRREFVKLAAGGAVAVAAGLSSADGVVEAQRRTAPGPDASERDLALLALDAARSAGAVYADARVIRVLSESINTRERQITNVTKSESYGIGVRAFVGGSWGFSATSDLTRDAVAKAAREAVAIATPTIASRRPPPGWRRCRRCRTDAGSPRTCSIPSRSRSNRKRSCFSGSTRRR